MYMLNISSPEHNFTLPLVEGSLAVISFLLSFAFPKLVPARILRVESALGRLAKRQGIAVLSIGLSAFLLRLAVFPLLPIPLPTLPDDFSALLAADTFAHGRLTNPTPAMWIHFESLHIDMKPTYMSMYFPAQGLILAAGKALFGHPWFGIWITSVLMCAGICWMLQAWLPPQWALLGGFFAVLRLGLFSYWVNSYTGGGTIAALGGALVLGALPRLMRTLRIRYSLLMAVGIVLLGTTRPYEGFLLCIPVAAALVYWLLRERVHPAPAAVFRCAAPALAFLIAAAAWMGYYNYRVFGSPLTLPYTVNRATYATAPYFVWQSPRPEPFYHHQEMRRFYQLDELADYKRVHSRSGFAAMTLVKAIRSIYFLTGFALLPLLLLLPRTLLDRRIRFLVLCLIVLGVGAAAEIYFFPHYLAPFTAAFYAVGLQSTRHLWHWSPSGQRVGRTVVRLSVTLCLVLAGLRPFDRALHIPVPQRPVSTWILNWFGPDHYDTQRAAVERSLAQTPGGQLAIVRYSASHDPLDEWVYNAADIDSSKVIWAREMDASSNLELLRYYKDRKVWLVQPDLDPVGVAPYPLTEEITATSH